MRLFVYTAFSFVLFTFCTPQKEENAVARVQDKFLYASELDDLVPPGTSEEDSIRIVKNYLDQWAKQQLLFDKALQNLSEVKQKEYQQLIEQYKRDLYIKGYIEQIVQRELDTVVTTNQMIRYYNENRENFKTNSILVKLRYIHLPKNHPKFALIQQKFYNFQPKKEAEFWNTYQLQFKNSALNDSIWVEMNQIYKKLPFLNPENRDNYIISGKSFQMPDSLDVYLVKINQALPINSVAPFEFVKPTIKEVIINSRQRELVKKFEKDITNDAIKTKKYEIY
jgi:hypothetical protein